MVETRPSDASVPTDSLKDPGASPIFEINLVPTDGPAVEYDMGGCWCSGVL